MDTKILLELHILVHTTVGSEWWMRCTHAKHIYATCSVCNLQQEQMIVGDARFQTDSLSQDCDLIV